LNEYLLSVLLGIVEGLTEFLPVSSTAHLRIVEKLLHQQLDDPFLKMYSIVIQLGAILVLPIYFRHHIAKLFSTFPEGEKKDCDYLTHPLSLVMIAFVVTAIPSFLLTKVIGKNLESLYVMGAALLIGGIVMWIIDAMKAPWEKAGPGASGSPIHTWKMDDIHGGQAIWIGACQILSAVFPGTSRSMSTIAAGQLADALGQVTLLVHQHGDEVAPEMGAAKQIFDVLLKHDIEAAGGESDGTDRIAVGLEEHGLGKRLAGLDDLGRNFQSGLGLSGVD